ncbi:hypothetical protein [Pseudoalteromonas carrageenovora]|uniref:hypothetical protein n=1 Tax=Pseudoalteromonas carrageenovora TaxID=227 RepID=UPI002118B651|nr:hypothetical protein [Pseudoalteromonas carrageenovora]MCQ8887943.1 hypothetical protein [Pseudoalteromonas carrageenovora]MDO6463843.1 hypothetical protein [Pseudoalteromonas carrageenovora]MDO6547034.1 hypothetical protein [Pseudoalteromonas carrageenovora]MDO6831483.1 hypothetical protein [Pseudoalteromonas carrageenovora]
MLIYRLSLFTALIFLLTACDFSKNSDVKLLKNAKCEANLPCTFSNGVKVWLSEKNLSPETPFTIFSDLPANIQIEDAKLKGITMYMGYIPQFFKKHNDLWQSNTMVGICSEKNMLWDLELIVKNTTTSQIDTLNYYFYVTY